MSSHESHQYRVPLVTTANLTGDAAARFGRDDSLHAQFLEGESHLQYGDAWDGCEPQQQSAYPDNPDLHWAGGVRTQQSTPLAADYSHSDVELSAQTSFGGELPSDPFPHLNGQIADFSHGIDLTPMDPGFHDAMTSQRGTPPPGAPIQWQTSYAGTLAHNYYSDTILWQGQSAGAAAYSGAHPPADPAGSISYARQLSVGTSAPPGAYPRYGAPTINESSNGFSPTTQDGEYYNAGIQPIRDSLRHNVAGEGNTLGISGAVVKHALTQNGELSRKTAPDSAASPIHGHPMGKKKQGQVRRIGHNCKDDGTVIPHGLDKDASGLIMLLPLYKRMLDGPKIPTEAFDRLIFGAEGAHAVGSEGEYICKGRVRVVNGTWDHDEEPCDEVLLDKDLYRRHIQEQHLEFPSRRKQAKKDIGGSGGKGKSQHLSVERRLRIKIEEMEKGEEGDAERIGRKRERGSDDDAGSGSSSGRAKRSKLGHMPTDV